MNKLTSIILLVILLTTLVAPSLDRPAMAGFTDDWLASTTAAGPDYAQGQKRGYMMGGSLSARWQPSSEYPLTIQRPKISAGCGGIDLFMGGFSFLGFDYLVKKFQAILMNAPALAFDLALKALAEQASTSIKSLDGLINMVNGAQLNECQIASDAVAWASQTDAWKSGMAKATSAVKTVSGEVDSWVKAGEDMLAANGNPDPEDLKKTVAGCSEDMKTTFLGKDPLSTDFPGGLFLDRITTTARLNIPAEYVKLIRGLVGDIMISSALDGFKVSAVLPCPGNAKAKLDDIINGNVELKDSMGMCSKATDINRNLYQYALDHMLNIQSAIKNKTPLANAQLAFVKATPVPVLEATKIAVASGQEGSILPQVAKLSATAIALNMVLDVYDRVNYATSKGKVAFTVISGAGTANAPETCAISTIEGPVLKHLEEMKDQLKETTTAYQNSYNITLTEAQASFAFINQFQQIKSVLKESVSKTFGAAFAGRVM